MLSEAPVDHSSSNAPVTLMGNRSHTLRRTIWRWSVAVITLLGLIGAVVFITTRTDRELRALPAADRRALYQRTLETLRSACMHVTGPQLSDYCCDQAEFVKRFPECDPTCRELAERFAPKPTHGLR